MKYDELTSPRCTVCGAFDLQHWTAMCDAESNVSDVYCTECNDKRILAQWDSDKRLRSSLTLTAALKTHSRPVMVSLVSPWVPPHPWQPTLHFRDGDHEPLTPVLYTPRCPDWKASVRMTLATRSLDDMARCNGGRVFDIYDCGRRVAKGVVVEWDRRWLHVAASSDHVHAVVKEVFEPRVWFGGLQSDVRATSIRALKGSAETAAGRVEMVTYCLAGRCMVQLDTPTDRITVITAEDESEPRMGVQGIDATEDAAVAMLRAVADAWHGGAFEMVESHDVSAA